MAEQSGVSIVLFTGPLFIGCMLSYFLSGCSFVQTVYFFQTTPILKRHSYIIALVSFVSIAELLNVIIVTVCLYDIFCVAIPNGDLSFRTPSIALGSPILNTLIAVSVQGHFALRIRKLSQGSWLGRLVPILVVAMGLVELGSSIGMTYLIATVNREMQNIAHQTSLVLVWFIHTALADIVITLTLVYIYLTFRRKTESRRSKNWLNGLILHSVENGAITSLGVILHFGLYIAHPNTLLHIGVAYVVCRLYSNVLLASVNSNRRYQRAALSRSEAGFSLSSIHGRSRQNAGAATRTGSGPVTSARRHSLSGAPQQADSEMIGTRTEAIQFTTINTSVFSPSTGEHSGCLGFGSLYHSGTQMKEPMPAS